MSASNLLSELKEPKSPEDEIKILSSLHQLLFPQNITSGSDTSDEPNGRKGFGHLSLDQLISIHDEELNCFMCYIFERRYGWSEVRVCVFLFYI